MKPNGRIQQFPLLRVALMLVAGIVAGDALYGAVGQSVWMLSAVALLLLSFTLWHRPITQSCVIMAVIVLAGAWRVTARLGDVCMTLPDKPVCYEAVVASRPVAHGKVVRCDLLVSNGALVRRKIRASILCNERDGRARRLTVGDGMRIVSELREPENYHADSNFDYRRWMSVHGFVATTFLLPSSWQSLPVSLDSLSRTDRISLRAMRMRELLLSRIHSLRGMSAEERAVVAAMTLGDKSGLTVELKETYSVTGASHVLALSGLHLGIIYFILTLLFSRRRVNAMGQAAVVVTIWGYVFMVGLPASAVRAATMFSLCSLVSMLNRDRMSLNTISFAAVVMLTANPLYLWDVGFQMSFMAVIGILVFYNPFYRCFSGRRVWGVRMFRRLWALTSVSVAAQLGVAPLIAYYFGRFSCYFILTNIIAVPLTTLIIYFTFILFALTPLPVLQGWAGEVLLRLVSWLNGGLELVASLPGASIDGIRMSVPRVALVYVIIACTYCLGIYAARLHRSASYMRK